MNRQRKRPAGRYNAKGHVAVGGRILRHGGGLHHAVEVGRRHHRIEPVLLVDRGTFENLPGAGAAFELIEKARARNHVAQNALDLLAHHNSDVGLGNRALAAHAHERRQDVMLRRPAAAALHDEFTERPAKPGHVDDTVRMKGREQVVPATLVAVEAPGLDQFGAGVFVGKRHGSGPIADAHSSLIPAAAITLLQRAISRATRSRNSCGDDGEATLPPSASRACTSGKASARSTSALSRVTIAGGVAGAMVMPSQDMNSMPGTVSATTGASGSSG